MTGMMLAVLLLALQPGADAPDDRLACAPRRVLNQAGPPPAVLHAEQMVITPRERTHLSVQRCPDRGFRVVRHHQQGEDSSAVPDPVEWVPVAQCAGLGEWIEEAAQLDLPSPMLRELRSASEPYRGTWFTLSGSTMTGSGRPGRVELEILDPPGAEPSALSAWFLAGERLFRTCRDQGHGGEGLLPPRGLRPRR